MLLVYKYWKQIIYILILSLLLIFPNLLFVDDVFNSVEQISSIKKLDYDWFVFTNETMYDNSFYVLSKHYNLYDSENRIIKAEILMVESDYNYNLYGISDLSNYIYISKNFNYEGTYVGNLNSDYKIEINKPKYIPLINYTNINEINFDSPVVILPFDQNIINNYDDIIFVNILKYNTDITSYGYLKHIDIIGNNNNSIKYLLLIKLISNGIPFLIISILIPLLLTIIFTRTIYQNYIVGLIRFGYKKNIILRKILLKIFFLIGISTIISLVIYFFSYKSSIIVQILQILINYILTLVVLNFYIIRRITNE